MGLRLFGRGFVLRLGVETRTVERGTELEDEQIRSDPPSKPLERTDIGTRRSSRMRVILVSRHLRNSPSHTLPHSVGFPIQVVRLRFPGDPSLPLPSRVHRDKGSFVCTPSTVSLQRRGSTKG